LKLSILLIETDPNLPELFWIASVDDSTLASVLWDSSQSRTRHGDLAKPVSDASGTPKRTTIHNIHRVNLLLVAISSLGSNVKIFADEALLVFMTGLRLPMPKAKRADQNIRQPNAANKTDERYVFCIQW
jgi:hypothetical protein